MKPTRWRLELFPPGMSWKTKVLAGLLYALYAWLAVWAAGCAPAPPRLDPLICHGPYVLDACAPVAARAPGAPDA